MQNPLFYPHERAAFSANGLFAAGKRHTDFVLVVRLWFPRTPLSWILTHTLADDDDLAYGLAVRNGDHPTFELGLWSIRAFESFAKGDPRTCLQSSSVFNVRAPLSSYVWALVRRRTCGY